MPSICSSRRCSTFLSSVCSTGSVSWCCSANGYGYLKREKFIVSILAVFRSYNKVETFLQLFNKLDLELYEILSSLVSLLGWQSAKRNNTPASSQSISASSGQQQIPHIRGIKELCLDVEDLHYFPKGQSVDQKYAESTGFMRPVKPKICRKEIRAPRSGVVVLYDQHNRPTDRLLRRHVLHSLLGQLFRCVTVIHSISKKEKDIIRHIRSRQL